MTEIYVLWFCSVEAWDQSVSSRAMLSPKAWRKGLFQASLPDSGGSFVCNTITPTFRWYSPCHVCVQISPFHKDISCLRLGAHLTPLWPYLYWLYLQWLHYQIGPRYEVLGVRTLKYEFGKGHISTRCSPYWGRIQSTSCSPCLLEHWYNWVAMY